MFLIGLTQQTHTNNAATSVLQKSLMVYIVVPQIFEDALTGTVEFVYRHIPYAS